MSLAPPQFQAEPLTAEYRMESEARDPDNHWLNWLAGPAAASGFGVEIHGLGDVLDEARLQAPAHNHH